MEARFGTVDSNHQVCFQKSNRKTKAQGSGGENPADSCSRWGRDERTGVDKRDSKVTILRGRFTYEEVRLGGWTSRT